MNWMEGEDNSILIRNEMDIAVMAEEIEKMK